MHEARVIPLDRRPHVQTGVTMYMGDARGYWDGDTLVVETARFRGEFHQGRIPELTVPAGRDLRIVERFTPTSSGSLEWSVTMDDASGWTRPWTFSMPLRKADDSEEPLEYACHEGNYAMRNMLSAARTEDVATADSAR